MVKEDSNKEDISEPENNSVIADMNVEGMPWYVKVKPIYPESKEPVPPLSRKELLRLTFSALAASLAVGLIFLTAFYLFIMFCVRIWFK